MSKEVIITAPKIKTLEVMIEGDAIYISNKFSKRNKEELEEKQMKGGEAKRSKKAPRDFDKLWKEAVHYSKAGWAGIPATSFRKAMISACRLVNYKMTLAKLAIFVEADGVDADDMTPLIKITKGTFKKQIAHVREPKSGTPLIVPRGYLEPGWQAKVRISYDSEQFREESIANLLHRVGRQVGIGGGRPDSTNSPGIGAGTFNLIKHKKGKN